MPHVSPILDPVYMLRTLSAYRWRWIAPTLAITCVALGYAVVRPKMWESAQALLLRDEAVGTLRAGRFADADSMKIAQETVSEIVRGEAVVSEALAQVGPQTETWFTGNYPTPDDVEQLQHRISVRAPNGAEFGKTEVFYLRVVDTNRERAEAITSALCDQLEAQLGALRRRKAESLMGENERTVELAREELAQVTARLAAIEKEVGSDLGELRVLIQPSGEGSLRSTLVSSKNDLRQLELVRQTKLELMQSLKEAEKNALQIVATPNELLESQPALKRLKDGLIDAQLQSSQLLSQMEPEHPRVRAALEAQQEIRERLHDELAAAVRGLQTELDTNRARMESLERQINELNSRLSKLAQLRVEYSNLALAVDRRNEILKKAEETLADSRASVAASQSVNLITRLDTPATGNNPIGPGRTTIAAGGLVGGLMTGLGILFLTVPLAAGSTTVQPGGVAKREEESEASFVYGAACGTEQPQGFVVAREEESVAEPQAEVTPHVDAPPSENFVVANFGDNLAESASVVETVDAFGQGQTTSVEHVSPPTVVFEGVPEIAPVAVPAEIVPAEPVVKEVQLDPWGQALESAASASEERNQVFSGSEVQPFAHVEAPSALPTKAGTLLGGALARLFTQTSHSRN